MHSQCACVHTCVQSSCTCVRSVCMHGCAHICFRVQHAFTVRERAHVRAIIVHVRAICAHAWVRTHMFQSAACIHSVCACTHACSHRTRACDLCACNHSVCACTHACSHRARARDQCACMGAHMRSHLTPIRTWCWAAAAHEIWHRSVVALATRQGLRGGKKGLLFV